MGFIALQVLVILGVVSLLVFFEREDAAIRRMRPIKIRNDDRNRR